MKCRLFDLWELPFKTTQNYYDKKSVKNADVNWIRTSYDPAITVPATFTFFSFQTFCSFLGKIFSIFSFTKSLRIPSRLLYFCKRISGLAIRRYDWTCLTVKRRFRFPHRLWWSARVYQPLYFYFTAILTVCIHGLGTSVSIFSSLCKHFKLWAKLYRCSTFELNLLFSAE